MQLFKASIFWGGLTDSIRVLEHKMWVHGTIKMSELEVIKTQSVLGNSKLRTVAKGYTAKELSLRTEPRWPSEPSTDM